MSNPNQSVRRRGWTLPEFVVAVAIHVILLCLLLTALPGCYRTAGSMQCKNNLKQIGMGVKVYETSNQCLPPYSEKKSVNGNNITVSVFYQLLPFLELESLTLRPYSTASGIKPTVFVCPVDSSTGTGPNNAALSNYAANAAIFQGHVDPQQNPPVNIRFNSMQMMVETSSTIIMGERLQNCNSVQTVWSSPGDSIFQVPGVGEDGIPNQQNPPGMQVQTGVSSKNCQPYQAGNPPTGSSFQAAHSGVLYVLRGDGQVSQLSSKFDPKSLNYYCVGGNREQWVGPKYTPFP